MDDCVREDNAPIPNFDPKTKTTIRNLRIREDTAKYLLNLDVHSAFYDPKSKILKLRCIIFYNLEIAKI